MPAQSQSPRARRALFFFSFVLALCATGISNAQSIPLTVEILTDGAPESMSLVGPDNGSANINPGQGQEWQHLSNTRSLSFGQDFNFDFNHGSTYSTTVSGTGGASSASSYSVGGGTSNNMYTTRYSTTTAPHDSQNANGNCDGWACISCGYSASTSATSTFAAGSYGTFSKRNDNGTLSNANYAAPSTVQNWTFTSGSALGKSGTVLRKSGGGSINSGLNCGGQYNNACSCIGQAQVDWMNGQSGSIGSFSVYDAESCSGNCGSCSVNAQTMGCFDYNVVSTNGKATKDIYSYQSGIIGTDVWIDMVEADFTGGNASQVDLWLVKGNQKIHLLNSKSHSGSNHDCNISDGYTTIGNNWSNSSRYRASGGNLNDKFFGASASGWWTLEAYDTGSGTQHTVDYFKIHFKFLSNGRFETTASVNSNQTIGDGVYIQNLTVDHNLAGDSFTLEAPNGTSYALYNLNDDQVYALDGAATTHFEGVNTNGTWRLKATSSNMTTDINRSISSFTLSFSGVSLNGSTCSSGSSNRAYAARVYPSQLNPNCTSNNDHYFYKASGAANPSVDLQKVVSRVSNHSELAALGHSKTGLKLVEMGDGIYDAYDIANDQHFTAARINGSSSAGHEVNRSANSFSNPLVTAVWSSAPGSHASNGSVYALPASDHLKGIQYASSTATQSPTLLALSESQLETVTSRPLHTGAQSWMNHTNFGSNHQYWKEWFAVVPDPLGKMDLLNGTSSTYYSVPWTSSGGGNVKNNKSSNYVGNIDFSQAAVDIPMLTNERDENTNLLAGHSSGAVINPIDLRNQTHSMWRTAADVQTYYSSELVTRYEQGTDFASGKIHVSFPITAPKYNSTTFDDVPYSGPNAVDQELPYWGLPNGVEGYAEMFVRIKNNTTQQIFTKEITSIQEPLMLKDCPFLIQDSIRTEISIQEILTAASSASDFNGGDEVEISAMVFWSTPARRTALWSHEEPDNREVLCTDVNAFTMTDGPAAINTGNGSSVTVAWNEGLKSTGGYMRLQRRNAANASEPGGGWAYIGNDGDTTLVMADTKVWLNDDADQNGTVDAISYTDDQLPHAMWECQRVEYRVEQDMCGQYNYTPVIGVNILGTLENPWILDDNLSNGIQVSEGRYPFKVKIDWATATDPQGEIAQFRVYRRLYQPATPDADTWEQIFSSEDFTWYIDQDIAAGTLYEYRVGALMSCTTGGGQSSEVTLQEFFPPAPYDIGFRSSMGAVSGEVLFENESPSGNVKVEVSPQSVMNARNSLELEDNEYFSLDLKNLSLGSANVWPDIHSTTPGNEWSISQWIQVPENTVENNTEFPLVSFNIEDAATLVVSEAFSIWGSTDGAPAGHFNLKLKQAGSSLPFTPSNIQLKDDTYYHVTLNMKNEDAAPGFSVTASVLSDESSTLPPMVGQRLLSGTDESLAEMRAGWHSITWNAAGAAALECGDPFALNFSPLAIATSQDACNYSETTTGCTDSDIAINDLEFDANLAEGSACNYSSIGYGELITARWFSDSSEDSNEAPAVFEVNGSNETLVHNFHSNIQAAYSANPSEYPYSMPVMSVQLPPGNYRMRVLDNSLSPLADAPSFSGNFSVHNDKGEEYVNCIQYLASEVNSGVYDFTINAGSCELTSTPGAINNLMTDCADCYSLEFDAASSPYSLTTTSAGRAAIGNNPSFAFWFRAPSQNGNILKAVSTTGNMVVLKAVADNNPSNTGGMKFALVGPGNETLSRTPVAPYNEYNLISGQWYHATLHLGNDDAGSFTLRSTNLNDADAEPWNSTREFIFSNSTITAPYSNPSGFETARLDLGGTDVLFHNLSIWSGALSKAQSLELFNGIDGADLYSASSGFTNVDGIWGSAPVGSSLDYSKLRSVLMPDNSGRLVDHMVGKQLYPNGFNAGLSGTETFQVSGTIETTGSAIGNPTSTQRSVRRAPWGICNPGCARISNACNYNPFANQHGGCQLACAGVTTETSELVSHAVNYDEIRGWTGAPYYVLNEDERINQSNHPLYLEPYLSSELSNFWATRYPSNLTPGLFLMFDADESLGSVLYDRSKFAEDFDSWNHNNAYLYSQSISTAGEFTQSLALPGDIYYSEAPYNLPQTLGNWTLSSTINGAYIVPNVKYQGSSSMFNIEASKSTDGYPHTFQPGMQVALVGDIMLASENRDFTDISAFNVDIDVVYQGIQPGSKDYSGTGATIASQCPVKGVRFKVDGVTATGDDEQPLETDANGAITLQLTRGEHLIVPTLDHLDDTSMDDDHLFQLTSTEGNSLTVTGPMLRTSAGAPVTYIDITRRRAVGRVIGGELQASKAWGQSQNNLGLTRFQLVQEYGNSDSPVTVLAELCPAVEVTTNTAGEYDVQLLPGQYRIATSQDNTDPSIETWNTNSWTDFKIEGWKGNSESTDISNTGATWVSAFAQHIKDDGSGGYSNGDVTSYSIWDMTSKQVWDQTAEYPDYPGTDSDEFVPSDAYARIDLVFQSDVEISVNQLSPTTSDAQSICATSNAPFLSEELGDIFLGEREFTVRNAANEEFLSPTMLHLLAHKTGVADPVVNELDLVPPFPLGLPIIKMGMEYCSSIQAIRKFEADIASLNYSFQDTAEVKGNQYSFSIQNTLSDPQFVSDIPLSLEDGGTAYGFTGTQPAFNPNDRVPRGYLKIELKKNGQTITTWNPFASVMGDNADLATVPGLMKSPIDQTILFQTDQFDAIIFGNYVSAPPVPISTDPSLDFILRDPPGDQSYCSLEQGSTFSFEKSIESGNQHSMSRERNLEVLPAVDLSAEFAVKPLGFGVGIGAGTTIDAEWGYSRSETYTKSTDGEKSIREEISATETVSTSSEEQSFIYGNNQDLYYGTVKNYAVGFTKHHQMAAVEDVINASLSSSMLSTLGIPVSDAPVFHFTDNDGDGDADFPMFFKKNSDGSIDPSNAAYFTFEWSTVPSKTILPASYFMKTEYTIENVDIPSLEALRDHYFKTSGFYTYPDGQASTTLESELGWSYPAGMKYANNDDHRWELFHQTFMNERNAVNSTYPTQASTLQKGYQVNADIFSILDNSTIANMGSSIQDGTAGFSSALISRIQNEALNGDDRVGPGYRFSVPASDLANAQPTTGDAITEIQLDSVRFYNAQINAWKRMLAENEFEKLNARKYIMDNVEQQFSDPSQLSTWIEDLESSSSEVNNWSIDDFSDIAVSNGNLQGGELGADNSIWDDADFEPFFLNFSGGGSSYTSSLSKTNISEVSKTTALSGVWNGSSGGGLLIGGAGMVSESGEETVITESRKNTEGTETSVNYTYHLSDDDEQDFYLVCVVPGKGLNGPLFLNLGSATSCPHVVAQPSEYSEWYAALLPTSYNLTGQVAECSTVTTPVWNRTLNTSTISLSTSSGTAFHAFDNQTYEEDVVSIATGPAQTAEVAIALGVAAGMIMLSSNGAGVGIGIALGGFAAGTAAMGAIDDAVASGWRNEVWADFGTAFSNQGYSQNDLQSIALATEETALFIADGMCSIIAEQDSATRANATMVQPNTVPLQKAKLTLTHDGNAGLESVDITQLMTDGVNLSFQMENESPEPWGGPSKYYLFNDATNTTLAANVSLGGGDPATDDYLLYPNWSDGAYSVLGSIEHNGIEEEQYMNGYIDFIMRSSCDINIEDKVRVNLNFEPACSGLELAAPLENWTANLDLIESGSYNNTQGDLALHVDIERNDFKNWELDSAPIVVKYRTGNSTQWNTISPSTLALNADGTMSDVDFTWAPLDGASICNMYAGADSTYCLGYEGEVLLQATSHCENDFAISNVSPIVTGYVDFIRPELFGSVLPADGFYEQGDELTLRWSEAMETTDPGSALNANQIEMWAEQNADFSINTGGLQFTGQEHLAVLQSSNLDASGWSATWNLWAGGVSEPTSITPGVVFCQGNHNTGSLSVELRSTTEVAVVYRAQGNVIDEAILLLPSANDPNWNPFWNQFDLSMSPNGSDMYDVNIDLNRTGTIGAATLNIPNFNLPSRRLTIGNGWSGNSASTTPLDMPLQNFRLWSSQKEEQLAANGEFIITGDELGLQVYLPLDEMGGTPVERSRDRAVIMEANWFGTHEAAALDFAGNTGSMRPSISGASLTSIGGKNTTVEFWMKPGGVNEAILGIGGTANPSIDQNMSNWSFEINGNGHLIVANGTDTLTSNVALSDAWHHVALVRHNNGSVNLYLDGDNVDSGSAYSHGTLQPLAMFIGARKYDAENYDMPFTGKFDELRVWSSAVPLNTLRDRMRDGVYGYDNLVLHAPFEARGTGDNAIASDQAYGYSAWDGYVTNNAAGSLGMPQSFNALAVGGLSSGMIQSMDAPLMQAEPQRTMSLPGDVSTVSWNSLSDQVIVELNENALYKYEDQLVTFQIDKSELRDAAGNSIADDLTFDFLIDRNPLKWGNPSLSTSGQPSSDLTLETTVLNTGNQSKYFEIVGLPAWLEASPSSGNINANSAVDVTFTVTDMLAVGEYIIDAKLKGGLPCGDNASGGFCYAERLTMNLDVFLETPELDFDPTAYPNSVPMIAKVFNGNIASSNERDLVMAYVGDELRGHAQLDMVVADQNLAFLTVFFDDAADANANVSFRVWDASTGVIRALVEPHWPNLESDPITVALSSNNPPPFSVFEPLLLRSTDKVETQSELTPGWNWVSVNVVNDPATSVEDAFKTLPQNDIVQIKTHNEGLVYNNNGTWQPAASNALNPNMRYAVQMQPNANSTWTMSNIGTSANHLEYTQDLVTGWNDLGYIPQQSFAVNDAMLSLSDADTILGFNDLIKSRYDGFAVHVGDGEWVGSLDALHPGQGYRLYLDDANGANVAAGTLEWPASFGMTNPEFRTAGPAADGKIEHDDAALQDVAAWPMNLQNMASSMPMIVRLELPSQHVQSMGDVIGAFVHDDQGNEQCVGQILPMDTEEGLLYFLSTFGGAHTPSDLTFRWKSNLSGVELIADEMTTFNASELKGSPTEPFLLHFSRAGMELSPAQTGGLVAYPNPFANELTIHWHGESAVERLVIEDANGRLIAQLDCDGLLTGPCRWASSQLESGVYFVRAITERGQSVVRVVK